jgi:hypothetical protein
VKSVLVNGRFCLGVYALHLVDECGPCIDLDTFSQLHQPTRHSSLELSHDSHLRPLSDHTAALD